MPKNPQEPTRPQWLTETCPSWCSENHAEQALEADRRHQSTACLVPAVLRQLRSSPEGGAIHHVVVTEELDVCLFREIPHDSLADAWLSIATNTHSLELTLESASRLVAALDQLIASARNGDE